MIAISTAKNGHAWPDTCALPILLEMGYFTSCVEHLSSMCEDLSHDTPDGRETRFNEVLSQVCSP